MRVRLKEKIPGVFWPVHAGLLRPELALAWYFDLPCETEAELAEIRRRFIGAERQKGGEA